jgi:hypothetical protein
MCGQPQIDKGLEEEEVEHLEEYKVWGYLDLYNPTIPQRRSALY